MKFKKIIDDSNPSVLKEVFTAPAHGSSYNNNFVSPLPEVYSGAPNRIDRYNQFEAMDLDSHVSASLDVISEFCTQLDENSGLPFVIEWYENPTESESEIVNKILRAWVNLNEFDNELFDIVRDVLKFGDQFFIKDPETNQWLRIYHANVEKIIVNESQGKKPEQYVIKNLDLNLQNLTVSQLPLNHQGNLPSIPGYTFQATTYNTAQNMANRTSGGRFQHAPGSTAVNAEHIVHLSMGKRGTPNWPFGVSILEKVFKSYKQKELIEDSVLIYRIQRAPQRRIFYIDVGDLPDNKAMQFVNQMKNSVSQRRIPSKSGGGTSVMDASYNPISIMDDYFFPQKPDGRGSKVDTLPGGETSWGMDELQYFDNKLARGLRVPSSYLPTGPDESPASVNDGRVGAALIQEYRFSEYCKRIQRQMTKFFDDEFKLYLKNRDVNVDCGMFKLRMVEPQSFAAYRKIELDSAKINNFNSLNSTSFFSKRWLMHNYLGLSETEINENERMFKEENSSKFSETSSIQDFVDDNTSELDAREMGIDQDFSFDTDSELETDMFSIPDESDTEKE